MKVSIIFGTRPEAIKLTPIILALRRHSKIDCSVCVTAQHREMLDQVLHAFEITSDVDLDIMRPDQRLAGLTARGIEMINDYLIKEKPDMVIVQGDTTTTFVASLAAFYNNIPIAHVEAGLRTGNIQSPWPEEANRIMTSRLAQLHFAPTEINRENLIAEGIPQINIFLTGNTVIDALFLAIEKIKNKPPDIPGLEFLYSEEYMNKPIVLITGHRRENFGDGLGAICEAIAILANRFPETQFVYPVHMNPNVRSTVMRKLHYDLPAEKINKNIHLIDPLEYLPFVSLMYKSKIILTDSGGIQEEAPGIGKPVLVMRDTTERPEAVDAGTAKLVGPIYENIVKETELLLSDKSAYTKMSRAHNPYGDGKATERIVKVILKRLNNCL
ncbi:MAG: UDP-N-acetylglucosamine 2-epimerase (non-hydrolyzing) [Colwellia sp.]|nr:UDP-N-acetylglucosamine 2-epimerase (non-hydrolyzing) [Colwellia sp.]